MKPLESSLSLCILVRSDVRIATIPASCNAFNLSKDSASFSLGVAIVFGTYVFDANLMGLLRTIIINLSCTIVIDLSCAIVIDLSCAIVINLSKGIKNTGHISNIWLLSRIKNKKVKQVSWLSSIQRIKLSRSSPLGFEKNLHLQ